MLVYSLIILCYAVQVSTRVLLLPRAEAIVDRYLRVRVSTNVGCTNATDTALPTPSGSVASATTSCPAVGSLSSSEATAPRRLLEYLPPDDVAFIVRAVSDAGLGRVTSGPDLSEQSTCSDALAGVAASGGCSATATRITSSSASTTTSSSLKPNSCPTRKLGPFASNSVSSINHHLFDRIAAAAYEPLQVLYSGSFRSSPQYHTWATENLGLRPPPISAARAALLTAAGIDAAEATGGAAVIDPLDDNLWRTCF